MKSLFLFILNLTVYSLFSQEIIKINSYDFDKQMNFYNVPGISISIINNDNPQFYNWGKGISQDTLFNVGTVGHLVVGLAIGQLVDMGLVDLDRDVNDYLESWKIRESLTTENRKVTLRLLLSHMAGISESQPKGFDVAPETEIQPPYIRFYPGLKRRFSWSGYYIVQKVIEQVTNKDFNTYINESVFAPLGMKDSTFKHDFSSKNIAIGHDLFGKEVGFKYYSEIASLGFWTTTKDLSTLVIEINKIINSDYTGIFSRDSLLKMLTYQKGGWGLGPSLKFDNREQVFRQTGFTYGFVSNLIVRPYSEESIIILANGENAWKVILELIHTIDDYKKWGL
ncbi:MAG: beta-lactamase family protein [Spirochaetales bacterium]|nr:beta-lactamase family protein [Spirochaetales bacterium]